MIDVQPRALQLNGQTSPQRESDASLEMAGPRKTRGTGTFFGDHDSLETTDSSPKNEPVPDL
jgi:hypothetical protein